MKHYPQIAIITLVLIISLAFGQLSLSAAGGVSRTINKDDLTAGAGSDLEPDYISSASAGTIEISNADGISWIVQVRKDDLTWDDSLTLYVKRTADGTGDGSISGGNEYQQVTGTYATLFYGSGDRESITVQIKLSGVSITGISPNTYSSSISFRVIEDSKSVVFRKTKTSERNAFDRRFLTRLQDERDDQKQPCERDSIWKVD